MYEVEVELDDGDWLLQAFYTNRQDALLCTMQLTQGADARRCRVVSMKWNPATGNMDRSTLLEASGPEHVPKPTNHPSDGAPRSRANGGQAGGQAQPNQPRQPQARQPAAGGARPAPGPAPSKPARQGVLMKWLLRALIAVGVAAGLIVTGMLVVYWAMQVL